MARPTPMVRGVGALTAHERPGATDVTDAADATTNRLAAPSGQMAALRPRGKGVRRPVPSRTGGAGVVPATGPSVETGDEGDATHAATHGPAARRLASKTPMGACTCTTKGTVPADSIPIRHPYVPCSLSVFLRRYSLLWVRQRLMRSLWMGLKRPF